jgi:hypothetical protein
MQLDLLLFWPSAASGSSGLVRELGSGVIAPEADRVLCGDQFLWAITSRMEIRRHLCTRDSISASAVLRRLESNNVPGSDKHGSCNGGALIIPPLAQSMTPGIQRRAGRPPPNVLRDERIWLGDTSRPRSDRRRQSDRRVEHPARRPTSVGRGGSALGACGRFAPAAWCCWRSSLSAARCVETRRRLQNDPPSRRWSTNWPSFNESRRPPQPQALIDFQRQVPKPRFERQKAAPTSQRANLNLRAGTGHPAPPRRQDCRKPGIAGPWPAVAEEIAVPGSDFMLTPVRAAARTVAAAMWNAANSAD